MCVCACVDQKLSVDLVLEEKKPKWLFKQASKKNTRKNKKNTRKKIGTKEPRYVTS